MYITFIYVILHVLCYDYFFSIFPDIDVDHDDEHTPPFICVLYNVKLRKGYKIIKKIRGTITWNVPLFGNSQWQIQNAQEEGA